jgi:sugar lactone lactonase YvrE
MGKKAEKGAGAFYRYWKGELRKLHRGQITIPNSLAFSPDRRFAYFTDTGTQQSSAASRSTPKPAGPRARPSSWLDLRAEGLHPDGSVTDAAGNLWNAQWGASRVACYSPDGAFLKGRHLPRPPHLLPGLRGPGISPRSTSPAPPPAPTTSPPA